MRPEIAIDPYGPSNGAQNDRTAGFGLPKRTGTPEPWVRRLADDGLSYFYQNKLDGSVQWTLPEANSTPHTNGHASTAGVHPQNGLAMAIDQRQHSRQHSDSTYVRLGQNDGPIANGNVYSDDSDVDPLDKYTGFPKRQQTSNSTLVDPPPRTVSQITAQPLPCVLTESDPQLTSAEKLAQTLQHNLTPTPPDPVTALSTVARQSVAAIVTAVQSHDPSARPSSQNVLEDRILASVVALRNLLYVSSPPYGHVPSHLYRRDGPASGPSIPQSLQAQLKPAQRRVTATLSKLVLAALAAQYDTISLTSEVSERMETDAAELDRALVTFVNEVQKIYNQMPQPPSRRLFATLLPTNVGLGLMGAGAAGSWKGLGWAPVDSLRQPKRDLSSEVLAELKIEIAELEERLVDLHSAVFDGSAGEPLRIIHMAFLKRVPFQLPPFILWVRVRSRGYTGCYHSLRTSISHARSMLMELAGRATRGMSISKVSIKRVLWLGRLRPNYNPFLMMVALSYSPSPPPHHFRVAQRAFHLRGYARWLPHSRSMFRRLSRLLRRCWL